MVSQLSKFDEHFVIREADCPDRRKKHRGSGGLKPMDPNMMNAGVYMLTPILLGLAIGYGTDMYFKTKPVWTIILLLAGMVSSFYNLFKLIPKQVDPQKKIKTK